MEQLAWNKWDGGTGNDLNEKYEIRTVILDQDNSDGKL